MWIHCYDISMGNTQNLIEFLTFVFGGAGILGAAFVVIRSASLKQTLSISHANAIEQDRRIRILEEAHAENTKKIGELEGQIHTLKTLPLEKLANSYATMAETIKSMGETQNKLLELMATNQHQAGSVTVNTSK